MINIAENQVPKRILLVDDERLMRESLRDLLRNDSYDVVEANNGAEAFNLFTQSKFDLVLTDGAMPFVGGDELAMKIRVVMPEQPILMITGHNYKPSKRNPVDAILQKPFDHFGLQSALDQIFKPRTSD